MLRPIILALLMGAVAVTTSACNTVKGVGRDIESVGDAGAKAM